MSSSWSPETPAGLDARHAVQIVTVCADGHGRRGSGYCVGPGHALTAAHVLAGAESIRARFVDACGTPTDIDVEPVFVHHDLDIAVLEWRLDRQEARAALPVAPVPLYGRLERSTPCEALGFPRFKMHREVEPDGRFTEYRDTRHAQGRASAQSGRRRGRLEIIVDPPERDPDPSRSPWEGMSGAAVWSGGCLIGVVSEHRRTDGLGTLTASRVDRWHQKLSQDERDTLHGLIGLPLTPEELRQADPRARHVRDLVAASLDSAREHPYVGAVINDAAPPLTDLYVGQRARRRSLDHGPELATEFSPDDLLEEIRNKGNSVIVVTGGPGGGKTTLLRTVIATTAERYLAGGEVQMLPILLPAADLLGEQPVPEVVAKAVTRGLSRFGLFEAPAAEIFTTEAEPGVPWLILVDGLDEIVLPEARRTALQSIASLITRARNDPNRMPSPFRFVLATRQLPPGELDILGHDLLEFELCPFAPCELRELATGWLRALGDADPQESSTRFIHGVPPSLATGLGTVPLMATILCVLHCAAPEAPMPVSRSDAYRRFVAALLERQQAAGLSGIQEQTRQALERFGADALKQARSTIDHFHAIVSDIAARQKGEVTTDPDADRRVLARIEASAYAAPSTVPEETWHRFLGDLLRRSGLFTEEESGFRFLHRTLVDYLAAESLASDHKQRRAQLSSHLADGRLKSRSKRLIQLDKRTSELSYVGFLLDASTSDDKVNDHLRRLARRGDLTDLEFLAAHVRLGTQLPTDISSRVTARLLNLARKADSTTGGEPLRAAIALADLGDTQAGRILHEMAEGKSLLDTVGKVAMHYDDHNSTLVEVIRLYSGMARVQAALRLADNGDERGAKLLMEFAHSPSLQPLARSHAAGALAHIGHESAAELLLTLARDPEFDGSARALAGRLLGTQLGDKRAQRILVDMARDRTLDPICRVNAAHSLVRLGDSRARSVLMELVEPPSKRKQDGYRDVVTSFVRVKAARLLAETNDKRAMELLSKLRHDHSIWPFYRRRAKVLMVMMHEGRLQPRTDDDLLALERDIREMTYGRTLRIVSAYFRIQSRVLLPFALRRLGSDTDRSK
ncbi:trypsin-like peptidase domain-containing protein [Streptomyces sp. NPDC015171]|uniref:trypsin-like peptidase domain-containing protein n=1 Tax=Streptomyces sp. NPDC015171 TaxID=3364945 RepID=UPI0036FE4A6F